MKKFTLFLTLITIIFTLTASASINVNVNGIIYDLYDYPDKMAEVHKSNYSGNISIMSAVTWNGATYTVKKIGVGAFEDCTDLTSVNIPNSVTIISAYAFDGCTSLARVNIPNSVMSIGQEAFRNCSSMTSITIPSSVTSIGQYAFYRCAGILNINCNIPDYHTNVTPYYQSKFSEIIVGDSVSRIVVFGYMEKGD